MMRAAVLKIPGMAAANAEAGALIDLAIAKSKEACFVEWIVGVMLAFLYVAAPVFGLMPLSDVLDAVGVWPLIAALAFTRIGDTIKRCVYYIWGDESVPNYQTWRGAHGEETQS